jgi:N-acetylglucosaminyldiphosphoundecaprenol N-acetyl-beta-D-mannosaminyltransferase
LLLEQVKLRFPALRVTGCEPSKFRQLEPDEIEALGERIVSSGAQILLAGLGCPRQETFAYEMRSLLPMPVLAVGAAFSFIAGTLSQAPPAMQRFGLEWLYRLKEEPLRLWRRYLLLNPYYVYLVAKQKLGMKFSPAGIKPLTHARFG